MADDDLIIKISAPGTDQAAKSVENLTNKLEELTYVIKDTGYGSKELKTLGSDFNYINKQIRDYNKTISDINKTNSTAAIQQQKLGAEINKVATQAAKLTTEQSKNALVQQRVATEMNKTATSAIRLQMQQDRAAAASEKMRVAAAKATAPYNQMRTALKDYEAKLYNAIAAGKLNDTALAAMGTKYNRLKSELDGVNSKFRQVTNTMDESKIAGMAFASFLGNLAANAIQNIIYSLGDMVKQTSQAGIALDGITNTFAAGARGWKQGGEEMEFVAKTADKLGLNLQSTYEPYAKFMTSFTRSGGTLQESRQIFEDLSAAMVALHLNSSQMENIFVALEQMANKGTVQSEELKRQLGNALPGAFELAAQSMGVTTAELMDMMKAGEVVSRDFLPKFAALVKDSLGKQVGIAVNQYNAHLNRLQSQTFLLQANIGQLLNAAITPLIQGGAKLLGVINKGTGAIKQSAEATTVLQLAMVAAGAATVMFITQFGIVNTTLTLMKTNAIAASKALWSLATNPIGATLLVVGGAALYCANSINRVNREYAEMAVQQQDVTNNLTGLVSEYSQLTSIVNKSEAQQEAYNRVLGTLRDEYPTVLNYIKQNDINLKNLTQSQADNIASLAIQQKMQEASRLKTEQLNNTWLKLASSLKYGAGAVLVGFKTIGYGIIGLVNMVLEAINKINTGFLKATKKIVGVSSNIASKTGFKEQAVALDKLAKSIDSVANKQSKYSKSNQWMKNDLVQTAKATKKWADEYKTTAEKTYKDTVATLGSEQAKLTQQLMYSGAVLSNVATGKKGKKGKSKTAKTKTGKSKVKKAKSEWQQLSAAVSDAEDKLRSAMLAGADSKTIEKLKSNLIALKNKQEEVNKVMQEIDTTVLSGYKKIQAEAKKATETYQNMIQEYAAGNSTITRADLRQAASEMRKKNAIVEYNNELVKSEDLMSITRREAGKLADSLVDTLFEPLGKGETVWTRFKDAGITALKELATNGIKTYGNLMSKGFQSAWSTSSGGFGGKLGSGIMGAFSGLTRTPIIQRDTQAGGGTSSGINIFSGLSNAWNTLMSKFNFGSSGGTMTGGAANILTDLNTQANTLTQTLISSTTPATDGMTSAIAAVASPATSAANSLVSMATSSPIAAAGIAGMSATMKILSPAATSAAPALMQMGSALATIATNASAAATSMAALAVATAAESVAKIPYVGGFLAPVAAGLTGAAIAAGAFMTGAGIAAGTAVAGAGQLVGGALSGVGSKLGGFGGSGSAKVIPHAKGGIVSSPTMFPMQDGNIGLAGEAGTEVIAPAKRMSNGEVGIGAVQPQVIVNNYSNSSVEVKKRPDNSMEIKILELNAMLSSSRSNRGFANAQQRLNKTGRQIG